MVWTDTYTTAAVFGGMALLLIICVISIRNKRVRGGDTVRKERREVSFPDDQCRNCQTLINSRRCPVEYCYREGAPCAYKEHETNTKLMTRPATYVDAPIINAGNRVTKRAYDKESAFNIFGRPRGFGEPRKNFKEYMTSTDPLKQMFGNLGQNAANGSKRAFNEIMTDTSSLKVLFGNPNEIKNKDEE